MDESLIARYITETFEGVEVLEVAGYTMFFYRDERTLPFVTLIAEDTEHDRVSNLDRPGVFRINIGVEKATFRSLFEAATEPPDYTAIDRLMPHPHYAAQSWIAVLTPSTESFERVIAGLLAEAYQLAERRYARARH